MKAAVFRFIVEPLEARRLLSTTQPTDAEQYLVELINRDRADPSAEAARTGVDLNDGLSPGTITPEAKQPLAINPDLIDSATGQSQWMLDNQTFSHTGASGTGPAQRMANAGYDFAGTWGWAENLAWKSHSGTVADTPTLSSIDSDLYIDAGVADRGHRINLMNGELDEIGVGIINGEFDGYNALMVTEDFAYTNQGASDSFLTGVAYTDADGTNFYAPGEGLGGIVINATAADGTVYNTTTWDSGGYSLAVPAGTYTVTAEDSRLHGIVTYNDVAMSNQNIELDFTPLTGTSADTAPPLATLVSAPRITHTGGSTYTIAVKYTDSLGVDVSSIAPGNLMVTGPNRYRATAASVSLDNDTDGTPRTATYTFNEPRRGFSSANNGTYVIHLEGQQVDDEIGNFNRGGALGQFGIRIATPAPSRRARRALASADAVAPGLAAFTPALSALAITSSAGAAPPVTLFNGVVADPLNLFGDVALLE